MAKFTAQVAIVDSAGRLHQFAPGDEVPEGIEVGEHVTDGATTKRAAGRPRKDDAKADES